MRIALITDTWHPQVNGVVRTVEELEKRFRARGHDIDIIHAVLFRNLPFPIYPELRMALFPGRELARRLESFRPDALHIMSEGPLGISARAYCRKKGYEFTTAYTTHWQLDLHSRMPGLVPVANAYLRWFHRPATKVFVDTEGLKEFLATIGLPHGAVTPLGVDTDTFVRTEDPLLPDFPKPVFLFFSRLSVEKSPEDFFRLDVPGTKLVIGDGPSGAMLKRKYGGGATFVGYKHGKELVAYISKADVLVFPSRTETFGLVVLEALACGVPVAAYDVMGPKDIITNGVDGCIGPDLKKSALACLSLSREDCRKKALVFSWEHATDAFLREVVPLIPSSSGKG